MPRGGQRNNSVQLESLTVLKTGAATTAMEIAVKGLVTGFTTPGGCVEGCVGWRLPQPWAEPSMLSEQQQSAEITCRRPVAFETCAQLIYSHLSCCKGHRSSYSQHHECCPPRHNSHTRCRFEVLVVFLQQSVSQLYQVNAFFCVGLATARSSHKD